jgi:hypothetical protein
VPWRRFGGLAWAVQKKEAANSNSFDATLKRESQMNYFMSVSSAQWILIEVGVLMQIVAIIAVFKQRAGYRMVPPGRRNEGDRAPKNTAPRGRRGRSKEDELAKLAKSSSFKQEFKFRQCR